MAKAIRRKKRDRIYFYDIFNNNTTVETDAGNRFHYDFTGIEYPVAYIFAKIKERIDKVAKKEQLDEVKEKSLLRKLEGLLLSPFCLIYIVVLPLATCRVFVKVLPLATFCSKNGQILTRNPKVFLEKMLGFPPKFVCLMIRVYCTTAISVRDMV